MPPQPESKEQINSSPLHTQARNTVFKILSLGARTHFYDFWTVHCSLYLFFIVFRDDLIQQRRWIPFSMSQKPRQGKKTQQCLLQSLTPFFSTEVSSPPFLFFFPASKTILLLPVPLLLSLPITHSFPHPLGSQNAVQTAFKLTVLLSLRVHGSRVCSITPKVFSC